MPVSPAPSLRLGALRAELARRHLDGFVVPRADEHQGEYVPPSAQRLAWLTGFTGSAGQAVVLTDEAALFTDGRYTLQARQEVDEAAFTLLHIGEKPPAKWIEEHLPAGARLGFDPWLHVEDQVERLRAAVAKAGGELVACPDNPLDMVWHDRPEPPRAPLEVHGLSFAGRSVAEKLAEVAETLKAARLDAAVLSDPASIAWLLNVRGGDVEFSPLPLAFAVVLADASLDLFIDGRKLTPAVESHLGAAVRPHPSAELPEALDWLGRMGRRVGIDPQQTPAAAVDRLRTAGAKIEPGVDPCALPKACKNAVELAGMRAAHQRDGAALVRFLAWLTAEAPKGEVDELKAAEVLEEFRQGGELFRGLSFPTIAGAGPNGAIVHYRADEGSNRRLEAGQLFLLDSGAQYRDGTTDVTRTVAIGPAGEEERRRFTLVLKGHIALATQVFPAGTTGSQLDVLARRFLWAAGLDYDHGTGHGVGSFLSVHEGPQRISKAGSGVALKPGMVLSIEPGYYKAGAYGIRLENLAAVTEVAAPSDGERTLLGFQPLTLAPFDRRLIEPGLLDEAERAWLDAYHARVAAEVMPLLDGEARTWLVEATQAL